MFARVNGVHLFYTKTGHGRPVLLLHGNGEDHGIFEKLIPRLARGFTVYALDSRGHGKSSRVPVLRYEDMAKDVAAFVRKLGLMKPVLLGFSDGGIVGLLVAAEHPQLLSRLIVCGANFRVAGLRFRDRLAMQAEYLVTRDAKLRLMLTQKEIPLDQLHRIQVPTLVVAGGRDLVRQRHTRLLARALPKGRLCLLPGETHASYVKHGERLYRAITPFFGTAEGG